MRGRVSATKLLPAACTVSVWSLIRAPWRDTMSPWWAMKSAPIMGCRTSACKKFYVRGRCKPRSSVPPQPVEGVGHVTFGNISTRNYSSVDQVISGTQEVSHVEASVSMYMYQRLCFSCASKGVGISSLCDRIFRGKRLLPALVFLVVLKLSDLRNISTS